LKQTTQRPIFQRNNHRIQIWSYSDFVLFATQP